MIDRFKSFWNVHDIICTEDTICITYKRYYMHMYICIIQSVSFSLQNFSDEYLSQINTLFKMGLEF